jgi:hypothetical protein
MTAAITLLVAAGIACLLAALVGDKVSVAGTRLPALKSRAQRITVGCFGGLLLIAGLAGLFSQKNGSSPSPNVAASNTPATGPATTGSAQSSGSTVQATASPSSSPRFEGTVTIGQTGVELDASPPATNGSSYTFNEIAGYLHPGNGQIAEWRGSSNPGPQRCHDWAQANSVQQLQLTSGMQLCVLTQDQRTAYVHVTSVSADGSTAQATAIVWDTTS